jgi:hypothetical protein
VIMMRLKSSNCPEIKYEEAHGEKIKIKTMNKTDTRRFIFSVFYHKTLVK